MRALSAAFCRQSSGYLSRVASEARALLDAGKPDEMSEEEWDSAWASADLLSELCAEVLHWRFVTRFEDEIEEPSSGFDSDLLTEGEREMLRITMAVSCEDWLVGIGRRLERTLEKPCAELMAMLTLKCEERRKAAMEASRVKR